MDFRLATRSDASNIAELHADSWQMSYSGEWVEFMNEEPY